MSIKFNCPNCKKLLSVKEHLAGKRAKCPACQKPLVIPAPVSAPADVEDLAMSMLAEKPAETKAPEPQTIDFTCPQCDEPIQMSLDMAGKQGPCPNCRRIIKVPVPKVQKPKDWRDTTRTGPSAARENVEQPAPDGAWDTRRTGTHQTSLEEAGALPVEPVTLARRLRFWGSIAAAVTLVLVGGSVLWSFWSHNRQQRLVDSALVGAPALPGKEALAEMHRAAGEYYLRTNRRDRLAQAQKEFKAARDLLAGIDPPTVEREVLLGELALAQVDAGGDTKQADAGTHLPWKDALPEVQSTLTQIKTFEVREDAARDVARKLVARGLRKEVNGLVRNVIAQGADGARPEAFGVAGLELLKADPKMAADLADEGMAFYATPSRPDASPALIALRVALDKSIKEFSAEDPAVVLGFIEGSARRDKLDEAQGWIQRLSNPLQVRAYLSIAEAQPVLTTEQLNNAARVVEKDPRVGWQAPWTVFRLMQLTARAGLTKPEDMVRLVLPVDGVPQTKFVADPAFRGRCQFEIWRTRLAAAKEKKDESDLKQCVEEKTPAFPVAMEWLARHNARVAGEVARWEDKSLQPLGLVGSALGLQDGGR
jgi:transcription elongation factor Elf1